MGILTPLVSTKAVVEKEIMEKFAKNPTGNLPVRANILRAIQKISHNQKNSTDFEIDWGINIIILRITYNILDFFWFV